MSWKTEWLTIRTVLAQNNITRVVPTRYQLKITNNVMMVVSWHYKISIYCAIVLFNWLWLSTEPVLLVWLYAALLKNVIREFLRRSLRAHRWLPCDCLPCEYSLKRRNVVQYSDTTCNRIRILEMSRQIRLNGKFVRKSKADKVKRIQEGWSVNT